MINTIIRFIDRDYDGCGNVVQQLVLVKTDYVLTNGTKERLRKAVDEIKAECGDDWDFDSVVDKACEKVFWTEGISYESISPDFDIDL